MTRGKILIVEDEIMIATPLQMFLEDMSFEICTIASNSDEALAIVASEHPELILMDINLPGKMNGILLANEVWNRFKVPSIFVSSYPKHDMPAAMESPGARGYITKPYNLDTLISAIESELSVQRKT